MGERRSALETGEVAKRSNAADCKSVALAASEVRILPSPPAFARFASFGWASQAFASFGWASRSRASAGQATDGPSMQMVRASTFALRWTSRERVRDDGYPPRWRSGRDEMEAGLPRRSAAVAQWARRNGSGLAPPKRRGGAVGETTWKRACPAEAPRWRSGDGDMRSGLAPPKRRGGAVGRREGGSNSVVESQPSKLLVAGSIPVSRSKFSRGLRHAGPPSPSLAGAPRPRSAPADCVRSCPGIEADLPAMSARE